jgi:hypothetical protein
MAFEYIKRIYVAFKESKWAFQRSVFAIFFIVFTLIPAYHTYTWNVPPDEKLFKAEGELFFEPVLGGGSYTGLKTKEGKIMFTCETTIGKNDDCIWDNAIKSSIQGKQATVYWYRQRYFLWFHRDRLVELWIGNDSFVSRAKTQRTFDVCKDADIWLVPLMFFAYVVADAVYRRIYRGREK